MASDGTAKNAASMACSAVTRAALALGYRRLISYLLLGERGTSYRACGWWPTKISEGGSWDRPSRPRDLRDSAQRGIKVRWEYGPGADPFDAAVLAEVDAAVGTIAIPPKQPQRSLFDFTGAA